MAGLSWVTGQRWVPARTENRFLLHVFYRQVFYQINTLGRMSRELNKWEQCAAADWEGGVYSIPLKWEQKYPINKGWQNLRLSPDEFPGNIESPYNRGRLLGIAPPEGIKGGWVVCVDLDSVEARQLAEYFLPPTGEIAGRPSKQRAHHFYECDPPPRTKRFRDAANNTILDLLSTGSQVVVEPSIHPSGELYQWDARESRESVDAPELTFSSGMLAAVCLLVSASRSVEEFHNYCSLLAEQVEGGARQQLLEKINDPALVATGVLPLHQGSREELSQPESKLVVLRAAGWIGSPRAQ